MKKVFIFFTNRTSLASKPIEIEVERLGSFDDNNNDDMLIVTSQKTLQSIDITKDLPAKVEKPYLLLIKDNIQLPSQQNNEEVGNCYNLQSILRDFEEIYLVIHKSKPSNYIVTLKRLFENKIIAYVYNSHIHDSIYYRILRKVFNDNSITDISSYETLFLNEFNNNELITFWKFLCLQYVKIQTSPGKEQGYINLIKERWETFLSHKKPQYSSQLKDIVSNMAVDTFRNDLNRFWLAVEPIINPQE